MAGENYSEKVSVNINTSTLSQIDILVDNGYFSNRSDFINQALRGELDKYRGMIDRIIEEKRTDSDICTRPWFIGISTLDKEYLESAQKKGIKIKLTGYGLLIIGDDVCDELIFETVETINVRGRVKCSDNIKKRYCLK